jgi:hypothetical protein
MIDPEILLFYGNWNNLPAEHSLAQQLSRFKKHMPRIFLLGEGKLALFPGHRMPLIPCLRFIFEPVPALCLHPIVT